MTNILGPKLGYVDMLDIRTQEANDAEAKAPVTRHPLRPSAAGSCTRELAYAYSEFKGKNKYEKEPLTPETTRVFALGHSVEYVLLNQIRHYCKDLIQVKYTQQGLSFFPLPDGTLLEGSLDAVFYSKEHKAIIDVKSKKVKHSNYYNSDWEDMDAKLKSMHSVEAITDTTYWAEDLNNFLEELNDPFFASNFLQLNFYACNPFIIERGINHAAIIQFNKNTCQLREVRFKPCQATYDKIKEKFIAAALATDNDGPGPDSVPRDYSLGSIKCAFCNYKRECWKDADTTKAFFKTLPAKNWPKDIDRLGKNGADVELLIMDWQQLKTAEPKAKQLEQKILVAMDNLGVDKIRLTDGTVYGIKRLKNENKLERTKT